MFGKRAGHVGCLNTAKGKERERFIVPNMLLASEDIKQKQNERKERDKEVEGKSILIKKRKKQKATERTGRCLGNGLAT